MEIPDPRQVYNGAQHDQAGDKSDIEVVPDTEDEAPMPDPSIEARHVMSDVVAMDIKGEVSQQSAQVDAVTHSCDAGRGETMHMRNEVINNEWVSATAQQRYSSDARLKTYGLSLPTQWEFNKRCFLML